MSSVKYSEKKMLWWCEEDKKLHTFPRCHISPNDHAYVEVEVTYDFVKPPRTP